MTLTIVTNIMRDTSKTISKLATIIHDITIIKLQDNKLHTLITRQFTHDHQIQDLTTRLHTLREEEYTHISREVHDGLGQLLTCLKMDIRWITRRIANGAPTQDLST